MPKEDVAVRLREGDYACLEEAGREEDVESHLRHVFRLGPGAAYYVALICTDLGQPERSAELLELQVKRREPPWSQESRLLLAHGMIAAEEYAAAEALLEKAAVRERSPEYRARLVHRYLEALYWQQKDREVLELLDRIRRDPAYEHFDPPAFAELALFEAVASRRLAMEDWRRLFVSLFTDLPLSEAHLRAYRYLSYEPEVLERFSSAERALLEGRYALAAGERERGIDLLEAALAEGGHPHLPPQRLAESPVIRELGFAYRFSGQYERGARFLLPLSARLPLERRLEAQEMAGRLYRRAGIRGEAYDLLLKTALATEDAEQRDRCLWFCLEISANAPERDVFQDLRDYAPLWSDPGYFDDLLDELITALAAGREISELRGLEGLLAQVGSEAIRLRIAYILARLDEERQAPVGVKTAGPADVSAQYYGLLLSALQDRDLRPLLLAPAEDPGEGPSAGGAENRVDALVQGFFRFGLLQRGYEAAAGRPNEVAVETLLDGARRLQETGRLPEAMRLMRLYLTRRDRLPTEREARLLFPRGYSESLEALAGEEDIPSFLLYALVREESYFDPESESSAGAVGLTQLMGVTASDMARLLGLADPDLRDPETNLRLGFHHFGRLYRRLENVPETLMAYNAGLSRLREWESRYAEFPLDLLAEVIPYAETRMYVRKLLVSSTHYGVLHAGLEPMAALRLFYPDLPTTGW